MSASSGVLCCGNPSRSRSDSGTSHPSPSVTNAVVNILVRMSDTRRLRSLWTDKHFVPSWIRVDLLCGSQGSTSGIFRLPEGPEAPGSVCARALTALRSWDFSSHPDLSLHFHPTRGPLTPSAWQGPKHAVSHITSDLTTAHSLSFLKQLSCHCSSWREVRAGGFQGPCSLILISFPALSALKNKF